MTARAKIAAVPVPQTRQEFEALAVKLGDNMRVVDAVNARLAEQISHAKLTAKEVTAPIAKAIEAQFKAVAAYAEAHRAELLPKDRKSLAIAAGTIGWRMSSPRVVVDDEDATIEAIEALDLGDAFLRVVTEIDKQAILADIDRAEAINGLRIEQREELFFKPLDLDEEKVRKAPAGDAA